VVGAADRGDGWIGWLHSASGFGAVREALREQRADLGRSGPFWYGIQVPALFSGPGARAEVTLPRDSGRYTVTGSPGDVVSRLREYWDAGADRFKLSIVDTAPGLYQLELLGREVLPELRSWQR
jgi:alkanesulfonate monooxygenase SsuD/methylene tetrahydromethanopterin reductase-like flavin-dependent oxidoreductase (luciferase family)